jgi:hypothetical protein
MIPHFFVMAVFAILLEIGVVIAWFVALFIGRIPNGAADFVARTIQYFTRVYAYGYLLTDRYPPFGLSRREYPVSVEISSGRLNRLAVLFRLIIQIPAYVVLALVGTGLSVAMVFIWLIVLVAGTVPASLYQAMAAILRYQTRFVAYLTLATSTYPWGLFGDRAQAIAPPEADVQAPTSEAQPSEQAMEEPTEVEESTRGTPAQPQAPLATTLLLTKPTKRLIALFLGLGVVWTAGYFAFIAIAGPGLTAFGDLSTRYDALARATSAFQKSTVTCQQQHDIQCEQGALRTMSAALDTFSADVRTIDFPSDAQADAQKLETDTDTFSQVLKQAASASSESEFVAAFNRIAGAGTLFDDDYNRLRHDLI